MPTVREALNKALAQFADEDANLEIHTAWMKEKDGDQFRDTQEWTLSWDYFKAGWLAARSSSAENLP